MSILSLSDPQIDSGIALYSASKDKVFFAINEERITRKKMMYGFPFESIKLIKRFSYEKIDLIIVTGIISPPFFMRLFRSLQKKEYLIRNKKIQPGWNLLSNYLKDRFVWFHLKHKMIFYVKFSYLISRYCIYRDLPENLKTRKVIFIEHHLSHAASAFFSSGFNSSLSISADGVGDGISLTISSCYDSEINRIYECSYEESLAYFYGKVTDFLGFISHKEEGKVTGLAAFGSSKNINIPFPLNVVKGKLKSEIKIRGIDKFLSQLADNSKEDIAAWLQSGIEKCVVDIVKYWVIKTGEHKLTLSGGLFANVKLNQKLLDLDIVDEIFVFPHMGDGGLSYGAILAYLRKKIPLDNLYLGEEYDNKCILKELSRYSDKLEYRYYKDIELEVAKLLSNSKIIARFNGRMEYGPRALGNRSILYTTTDPSVQKWLNKKLKRTEFMPFAPTTLEEFADKCYFNYNKARLTSKFMTVAFRCKDYMKKKSPAVIHVDGTARPQIISKKDNESYYMIIQEYYKLTKIPSILNTSFNMHGEPIVRTPEDAIKSFIKSNLDYLAIGNYLVKIMK